MTSLREFDLQSRGVAKLVECWRREQAAVRSVWKLEDLIAEWMRLAAQAKQFFDYYCEHAQFPQSNATLSYFIELLHEITGCGDNLTDVASMFESQGYQIDRADELRRDSAKLQAIVKEDRFATEAAFSGGALDDWD